jgi:hypothetical protein
MLQAEQFADVFISKDESDVSLHHPTARLRRFIFS